MYAVQHARLLGFILLFGAVLFGIALSEVLARYIALSRGALALLSVGVLLLSGDFVLRAFGGAGSGAKRYLTPSGGPHVRGIPVWVLGIIAAGVGAFAK